MGNAVWGWGRPTTIHLKVRGDHQSRISFFSIWHPPRAEYKIVRNTGDRPRKRRRLTELTERSKERERTKDSQGKHKEEEVPRAYGTLQFRLHS